MDFRSEVTHLLELAQLCRLLAWHADDWTEARNKWLERQGPLMAELGRRPPDGLTVVAEHLEQTLPLQRDMWLALEGFLGAWARASLMLFPATPKSRAEAHSRAHSRAHYLCTILGVSAVSSLSDRGLRNAWTHFDEHLDDALATGEHVAPQRWALKREPQTGITMRTIMPDANCIIFRGEQVYDLSDLFQVAEDLRGSIDRALETIGERHAEELSAPDPLEY